VKLGGIAVLVIGTVSLVVFPEMPWLTGYAVPWMFLMLWRWNMFIVRNHRD
jgi:hypothetical protein